MEHSSLVLGYKLYNVIESTFNQFVSFLRQIFLICRKRLFLVKVLKFPTETLTFRNFSEVVKDVKTW